MSGLKSKRAVFPESIGHTTQGESKLDCATKSGAIQHVLPPHIWVHYNANVIR